MQNDLFNALNDPEEKITELPDLVDWVSRAPTAVSRALGDNLIVEYTNLFDASLSLRAFDAIDATTQWRQDQIRIAGRTIPVPSPYVGTSNVP